MFKYNYQYIPWCSNFNSNISMNCFANTKAPGTSKTFHILQKSKDYPGKDLKRKKKRFLSKMIKKIGKLHNLNFNIKINSFL